VGRFFHRFPDVGLKIAKKVDRIHAFAAKPEDANKFFDILGEIYEYDLSELLPGTLPSNVFSREHPVLLKYPELIVNFDETGNKQVEKLSRILSAGKEQPVKVTSTDGVNLTMGNFIGGDGNFYFFGFISSIIMFISFKICYDRNSLAANISLWWKTVDECPNLRASR
jgi:hypothetical protein